MQTIYVKIDILGMECTEDDEDVSQRAHGVVTIKGKKTRWDAEFTSKWVVMFKRELENQHWVEKEISNKLGYVNLPVTRTVTYDVEK